MGCPEVPVNGGQSFPARTFDRPERLFPAWTLHKGARTAECVVWSHQFGLELRVTIGDELIQSAVIRSQEDLIATQESWRAAFETKAWKAR